jgi:hypothetical protein
VTKQVQSRARAREVSDQRTAHIMDLMANGRWVTGRSHQALAEEWGCEVGEVEHVAQRAGQALRVLMLVDRDDLRARNAAHLESLAADAHAAGEYGDAVRARAEMSKLLGLNAPEKHEHAVVVAQYERLAPPQRAAWLRERAQVMLAEAARLEAAEGQARPVSELTQGSDAKRR